MQQKLRAGVRLLHLTHGKGRGERRARQESDRQREGRLLGTVSPTKKNKKMGLCKNSSIPRESGIVSPLKSDHFQAAVSATEFTSLYITPQ